MYSESMSEMPQMIEWCTYETIVAGNTEFSVVAMYLVHEVRTVLVLKHVHIQF